MELTTVWQAACRSARGLPLALLNSFWFGDDFDDGMAPELTVSRRPAASVTESDLKCKS